MVRKSLNVTSAKQLNGASVCVQQGTTTELNVADYFRANNMKVEAVAFATSDETLKAYDFWAAATPSPRIASGLYAERLKLANADQSTSSCRRSSPRSRSARRPGTATRQWSDIVRWTHNAMLECRGTRRHQGERLRR